MNTATRKGLGYVRISHDAEGRALGVGRQAKAVRALATAQGVHLVDVIEENDQSATKGSRARWRGVIDRLGQGDIDVLAVYGLDRATRTRRDTAELLDTCAEHGIDVLAVNGGALATSTPAGRMAAGVISTVSAAEVENMAMRQRAANVQRAEAGEHLPRGSRTYGWASRADGGAPIEHEQAVVREVFDRLADGEPVYAVAADLAARGVTTTKGKPWTRAATRYVATNDTYVGRSTLHRWVRQPDGVKRRVPVVSTASKVREAVVDRATFDRVQVVLSGRAGKPRAGARWLLSGGVGQCHCGAPLSTYGRGDRTFYRCSTSTQHGSRLAERIDTALVVEIVLPVLVRDRGVRRRDEDQVAVLERELADLVQRESEVAAQAATGAVSVAVAATLLAAVEQRRGEVQKRLASLVTAPVLDVPEGASADDVRAAWEALSVERQRDVIRRLATVVLHRSGQGRRSHPLSNVEVVPVA